MPITLEAIYEDGVLRFNQPLPLNEHEKVRVTLEPVLTWAERTAGILNWSGSPEMFRQVAEGDEFSVQESP
jgi:predicted DNA-binding antitoxin AbrB/MazE fold protein